jgi:hypothetical protein
LKPEQPAQGRRGVPQKEPNHEASLAVWDVPSRTVTGRRFRVKVGAKCSAGCELTGGEIEVKNETGATVSSDKLGETPWLGTSGLYWAEVDLAAPAKEGVHAWSATLASAPHQGASSCFSFLTVEPPEHTVTVRVIDRDTKAPVQDVAVRLGVYRASTGENGLAEIETAKGVYDLIIHKVGYETSPRTVEVTGDVDVPVEIVFAPKAIEDSYWG